MSSIENENRKILQYYEKLKEDAKNAVEDDFTHGWPGNIKPIYDTGQIGYHEIVKWNLERKKEERWITVLNAEKVNTGSKSVAINMVYIYIYIYIFEDIAENIMTVQEGFK